MEKNNVIQFPKTNVNTNNISNPTIEDINKNIEQTKFYHIQETMQSVLPLIFNQIEVAGFAFQNGNIETEKHTAFMIEGIRSFLCHYYKIYHPFQDIYNDVFSVVSEEENIFKLAILQ